MKENFKILPLGGIDENGKNAYVLETNEDIILIDAGYANFANKNLGIDVVVPDFSYLIQNKDKIRGIFISHGHFDQMGSLLYLLKELKVNIYASFYTIGFLKFYINKNDHKYLKELKYGVENIVGQLTVEVFSLSHEIYGNFGFCIANKKGDAVVYATDYNFDQTTNKFARTDVKKIVNLSQKYNIELLMTESVNATKIGMAASEQKFLSSLNRYIASSTGRKIIAMNSSNLAGFTNIIRMAELHKKKIVIIGRDLLNYVNIAKQSGYITHERDIFCRIADISKVNEDDLIIVIAGLHAEPFLDLTKMAKKNHNLLQLKPEDNVLIAADTYDEIESFVQKSLDIIARSNCSIQSLKINVPANAYQEDIKMMINLFEPKFIVPIKGEYRQLKALKDLALRVGYEPGNVIIINNGDILSVYDEYMAVTNDIKLNETYFSESEKGQIDPIILKDREVLADNGYVMIIMMVQKGTNVLLNKPEIISGGLIQFNDDAEIVEKCRRITINEFNKGYSNKELINKLKVKVARNLQSAIGKTPMILPVKIEIDPEGRNNGQKQEQTKAKPKAK